MKQAHLLVALLIGCLFSPLSFAKGKGLRLPSLSVTLRGFVYFTGFT